MDSCHNEKLFLLQNFQSYRILQTKLVFIHGLPHQYSTHQHLNQELHNFGPIIKLSTQNLGKDFYSAFIQYQQQFAAALAIITLDQFQLGNRALRVFYGSTKFCPHFLKNHQCRVKDCNYAHYYHPFLTHLKENAKFINHTEIARLILIQNHQQISIYFQLKSQEEHSNSRQNKYKNHKKCMFPSGKDKLNAMINNGEINSSTVFQDSYEQQINTEVIQHFVSNCQNNSEENSQDKQLYENNETQTETQSITLPDLKSIQLQPYKYVEIQKNIEEWIFLGREINHYYQENKCRKESKREKQMNRKTHVQQFLDDADRILMQLVFKSSTFAY